MGADRVEQGQRAAAGADDQAEVAVELGHVAGHAAVVLGVDLLAGELERGRLAGLARLLVADAELLEQRLLARAGLVLHVHVRVEGDERAVLRAAPSGLISASVMSYWRNSRARRARIGVRRVSAEPVTPIEAISCLACQSANGRRVEKCIRATWSGWLSATSSMSMPAHVGEQHHRALADPVPDHAGVVLVGDRGAGVDQHATRHVAADLEAEHVLGVRRGLVGGVGELHAPRLHPARRRGPGT